MKTTEHHTDPKTVGKWAQLIQRVRAEGPPWHTTELGQVLRHQLSVPWAPTLETEQSAPSIARVATLGELFTRHDPPLELLRAAKDFAKANCGCTESQLPPQLAHFLYYVTIAVAWVRCGQWITGLSERDLHEAFRWVLDQPWAADDLKGPVRQALACTLTSPENNGFATPRSEEKCRRDPAT